MLVHPRLALFRSVLLTMILLGVAALPAVAQPLSVICSFTGGGGSPYAGLVEGPDGRLYGTTAGDGLWGQGSVYALTPEAGGGFAFETLHSFSAGLDGANPLSGLVLADDGHLYGTTTSGFVAKYGTIFRIDTAGNLTTLYEFQGFADGGSPQSTLIQASDGNLYGVAVTGGNSPGDPAGYGTVFRMTLDGVFSSLHTFTGGTEGSNPRGALLEGSDGYLYGTTTGGDNFGGLGTIYRISLDGDFENLHAFAGPEGKHPVAGLVVGPDGFFYGTTQYGGDNDGGTVFRTDTAGTVTAFSFPPGQGGAQAPLVLADDGDLYGTKAASVYRFTTAGQFTNIHLFTGYEAGWLVAPVMQASDGLLYGASTVTDPGFGRVYRLETDGDGFETVYQFAGSTAPRNPIFALFQGADGFIYGTAQGGALNGGTVFRLDLAGNLSVLHELAGGLSGLVRTPSGELFGTSGGGAFNLGMVFRIDAAGVFSVVHDFDGDDGTGPTGLTLTSDGGLLGGTYEDLPEWGTLYRIDSLGVFETLHVYEDPAEGRSPNGNLVDAGDGTWLGTTPWGGTSDLGTVFRVDEVGDVEVLHSFQGFDGAHPAGKLVRAPDGNFYGLTNQGGVNDWGTMYRVSPSGRVTMIHLFNADDGLYPVEGLVVASDGNLYGATRAGGTFRFGNVFRADGSGHVTTLHSFSGIDGKEPMSQVFQGFDGGVYGATWNGGLFGAGAVFRLQPPPASAVWKITPASGSASGGVPVTVSGFGFSFPAVTIGGVPATDIHLVDPTSVTATTPSLPPGTLNDLVVTNTFGGLSATLSRAWFADFLDVPQSDIFHDAVESVFRDGVAGSCGGGLYCRDAPVTRAWMAVFLLRGKHGGGYRPPPCTGGIFVDVPCPGLFSDWIEQLFAEEITGGCALGYFCPASSVTRAQMAVFLLKAEHGSDHVPPDCSGVFEDVPCPGQFTNWIEELYGEQVTGGCSQAPLLYCPANISTRGQMAVFLVRIFALP